MIYPRRDKSIEKLSKAAEVCISKNYLSSKFFQAFYVRRGDLISERKQHVDDKQRADVHTEESVQEHFFSKAGLEAELIDAGIMDPVTKVILDPRRVLNRDECPQFIDFNSTIGGGQKKVAVRNTNEKRDKAIRQAMENRECVSVDMTWGLDGFAYGAHVLVARENITEGIVADELEGVFDNQINEHGRYSTHGLITNTKKGVQTGVSLLEAYKMLDKELEERNIPRPVVMLTDNHESRYDDEVLAFLKEKQIRQFAEKPKTSRIFQALDQYNRKFHIEYRKGVREFKVKEAHRLTQQRDAAAAAAAAERGEPTPRLSTKVYEADVRVGMADFLNIFSLVWFTWSTAMDRITSFRRVGITTDALRPDLICRDDFAPARLEATPNPAPRSTSPMRPTRLFPTPEDGGATQRSEQATSGTNTTAVVLRSCRAAFTVYSVGDSEGAPSSPQPPQHIKDVKSPELVRKGSAEYWRMKAEAYADMLNRWEAVAGCPEKNGVLVPEKAPPPRQQKRTRHHLQNGYGSMTLNDVHGEKNKAKAARTAEAERIATAVAARKEVADARDVARQETVAAWEGCRPVCTCSPPEGQTCPQAKLKYCRWCKCVKRNICAKKECKALAAASLGGLQVEGGAPQDGFVGSLPALPGVVEDENGGEEGGEASGEVEVGEDSEEEAYDSAEDDFNASSGSENDE